MQMIRPREDRVFHSKFVIGNQVFPDLKPILPPAMPYCFIVTFANIAVHSIPDYIC